MPDRALHRRILAPRREQISAAEPGPIDPVPGVELKNDRNPHRGPSPGESPTPLPVLRAPVAAAMRRSALRRSTATAPARLRPIRVAQPSSRARRGVSVGRGTPAGHDRRKVVLQAVLKVALRAALQDLRPLTGPSVRRFRIGQTKHVAAKHAVAKDAVGLLRGAAGPAAPSLPDSAQSNPGPAQVRNPVLRDGRSRDHPRPVEPGRLRREALARCTAKIKSQGTP